MSTPSPDTWTTSTSIAEIAARLRESERTCVLTHAKPDGDAVGSSLALVRALRAIGRDAEIWHAAQLPAWHSDIVLDTPMRHLFSPNDIPSGPAGEPDAIVITDTGSWSQLAEVEPWLRDRRDRAVIIDHHLHGDGDVAPAKLIDTKAAAATQIVAPICEVLLEAPDPSALPVDVAEPLYLGLATDTGFFRFSNVSASAMHLAASLLGAGVDHTRLYELVSQQDEPARWRLLGAALSGMELHEDDSVATLALSAADFARAGAKSGDSSGFGDMLLSIRSVRVALVFVEGDAKPDGTPLTKVSLRSKHGPDAVNVNELARKFGGGGHARASGARTARSLADTKAAMLAEVATMLR